MDVGVAYATGRSKPCAHDCAHNRADALVGHNCCGRGIVQGHLNRVVKLDDCNTHGLAINLLCQRCNDVGSVLLERAELAACPAQLEVVDGGGAVEKKDNVTAI